jgi:hypothetical protein
MTAHKLTFSSRSPNEPRAAARAHLRSMMTVPAEPRVLGGGSALPGRSADRPLPACRPTMRSAPCPGPENAGQAGRRRSPNTYPSELSTSVTSPGRRLRQLFDDIGRNGHYRLTARKPRRLPPARSRGRRTPVVLRDSPPPLDMSASRPLWPWSYPAVRSRGPISIRKGRRQLGWSNARKVRRSVRLLENAGVRIED